MLFISHPSHPPSSSTFPQTEPISECHHLTFLLLPPRHSLLTLLTLSAFLSWATLRLSHSCGCSFTQSCLFFFFPPVTEVREYSLHRIFREETARECFLCFAGRAGRTMAPPFVPFCVVDDVLSQRYAYSAQPLRPFRRSGSFCLRMSPPPFPPFWQRVHEVHVPLAVYLVAASLTS